MKLSKIWVWDPRSRIQGQKGTGSRIHDLQHWLHYTLRLDVVNKEYRAREIQKFLSALWNRNYFLRFRFRLLKSYGSGSGSTTQVLIFAQEPALPGGKAGAGQEERRIPVAQAGEAEWTGEGDKELAAAGTPARREGFHRQGERLVGWIIYKGCQGD